MLRTSSPCYRCTTAVAKFAAVTAIFLLLREICDRKKLSWNGNFICFGLGLSPRNETKQWEFQNCPCWTTMMLLWKYWRSHSFTHMKFLVRYKHAHSFCRSVLSEYHGSFMRCSAAFVLLRLLRNFVERFCLLKKHDCKNPECVNLSFKELVHVKRKSFGNPCFSYHELQALAFSEFKKSVGREYIGKEPRRK